MYYFYVVTSESSFLYILQLFILLSSVCALLLFGALETRKKNPSIQGVEVGF